MSQTFSAILHDFISYNMGSALSQFNPFFQSLKKECIRPKTPLSLEDARRIVGQFVDTYNNQRLHSAIGYITPWDKLAVRAEEISHDRERKLMKERLKRKEGR